MSAYSEQPRAFFKGTPQQNHEIGVGSVLAAKRRLEWAQNGAAFGIPVVPIKKGSMQSLKQPRTLKGWRIRGWAKEFPGCNFAYVLTDDWCVLNVDKHPHLRDEDGFKSLLQMNVVYPIDTFIVKTSRGGRHYYFKSSGLGYTGNRKLAAGVHLLGQGHTCLTPFTERDGRRKADPAGLYLPIGDFGDAKEFPDWLATRLKLERSPQSHSDTMFPLPAASA